MDEDDLFNPYGQPSGSVRDPIPGYFGSGSVSVPGAYSDPSLDPGSETVGTGGGYTEQTMVATTGPVYRIAPKDEPDRTLLYVGGGLLLVAALYAVTR